MKALWPDIRRGFSVVNKMLPAVAVLLGLVSVLILTNILNRQHEANLEFCARSNDGRVSNVHNLKSDVHTLRAQLNLWTVVLSVTPRQALAEANPSVLVAFNRNIEALHDGISKKKHSIETTISAQAPVAVRPGSPVVDCQRAYP